MHQRIKNTVIVGLLLFSSGSFGQANHIVDLSSDKWNFTPKIFYIESVKDERPEKASAGQVLSGDKKVTAQFKNSLSEDVLQMINASMKNDTAKIPVLMVVEKFWLSETGTKSNHKAKFDFLFSFYREINNKRYKIYETKGNPELTMRGPYEKPHEKMIVEVFRSTFMNFNDYLNDHPDLAPMARAVEVMLEPVSFKKSSDTIAWDNDYKLKWNDFKGKKGNVEFMAQSNCLFLFNIIPVMKNYILQLHINLEACFEKNSSWVKKGAQNDTLLKHEQLHFDICELNIRNLRKIISQMTFDPMEYDIQVKPLIEKAWNDYQLQQQDYDDETMHGIIYKKQIEWENRIREELGKE